MDSPNELLEYMSKNIAYGYMDKNQNKHNEVDKEFSDSYVLQMPEELEKSRVGVCWDQVEYERENFEKNGYEHKTFFIVYYNNNDCPTHTFLTYKENDNWFWFENSWENYRGIYEYDDLNKLLQDVKTKFTDTLNDENIDCMKLCIYEYGKVNKKLNCLEFYKHAEKGKNILI